MNIKVCEVTLSDLKGKLVKNSSPPATYSSQADGQSINYSNAHRDVRRSGQQFNEKQSADWLLKGPLCLWLPLLQTTVTWIGLDAIKVTLIFSCRLCMHVLFPISRCVAQSLLDSSIFTSTSQDSDKVLLNPNRSESKPKCHPSFAFPLRDFSPIQISWSYLEHCANREHPVFKPGEALSRILVQGCGCLHSTRCQFEMRDEGYNITPSAINYLYLGRVLCRYIGLDS